MPNQRDDERLEAWRSLVNRTLQNPRSRYASYSEDVAQGFVIQLIEESDRGNPIPECPSLLPDTIRSLVYRNARAISVALVAPSTQHECEPYFSVDIEDGPNPRNSRDLERVRIEFKDALYEKMIEAVRQGTDRPSDLAAACEMPGRTFRHKRQKLKLTT